MSAMAIVRQLSPVYSCGVSALASLTALVAYTGSNLTGPMSDFDDLTKRTEDRHSKRVTAFTIAIARALGVPREQILVMSRGAFLHDIGKMAIPDRLLRKSGKLDDDEMTVMRQHCVHGYQMLKRIPFLAEACETVL